MENEMEEYERKEREHTEKAANFFSLACSLFIITMVLMAIFYAGIWLGKRQRCTCVSVEEFHAFTASLLANYVLQYRRPT